MTTSTQPEFADTPEFRKQIRAWLEENCPDDMRDGASGEGAICWGGKTWEFSSPAQKLWLDRCAAAGLTVPTWPRAYGGAGLFRAQDKILKEEMAELGARSPLDSFGIWMLGPALLKFGSEEQKQTYLPPIARGEIRWCQGYSEPGAGSDLAGVQSRAEDRGDHWLVNGQKIWTSYADKADWIFALLRTDRDAPKHKGISFILMDMSSKGVSTRPIRLISGASPFCETFFDDVEVPKSQVVGDVNRGWDVAKYLLTHEREMISAGGQTMGAGRALGAVLADAETGQSDPVLRADAMRTEVDALAMEMTLERYKDQAEGGQGVGDASAMLKYAGTELNKRRLELVMAAGGSDALDWDDGRAPSWLRTKANSIEGGTSEVMLSIISRRILGLPG
ncbi:acyl-CoA dehydrogenase family protein [Phaeobacter gallaeciensis]|uniref:acyl-CoA dehydrogenase family protein n=1 Tax=Phaeobacter gallaeciensis TaxID=60890 RepID=UPI00237F8EDC|nr:acyl-CoA dehydrogenase family protein [Phaeobacter gallaeciensis]MDE4192656.1 acyl-CoA dehydrogenase family protein [Phaeobacter gallaeciensis]MDE4201247.1 acyl-CoA dehydrogenase family protein [Phaeobacter gallaeciensis]MDE4205272.1 acyl-CoA dehydrogenase family protein [Phaeobacter gallaeciensis]MDE4209570.1 acyl-CoA dehydrogenase family protein [Phaeobacter gallaeciensis]MDE4217779.1 acyl-CoA dehydrogenase family protein [Phaeobacter gallaeciensis]